MTEQQKRELVEQVRQACLQVVKDAMWEAADGYEPYRKYIQLGSHIQWAASVRALLDLNLVNLIGPTTHQVSPGCPAIISD